MVCSRYDLNPFLKQIHAFKDRRGVIVPIVGVDGWVDLINREKRYRGVQFSEIMDKKTGKVLGSTCRLYVDGLVLPVEVTEWLTECYRNTEPWNKMPRRLIRHKSLMQAGRYAFGFSGIYDEDEGRDIIEGKIEPIAEPLSIAEASEVVDTPTDGAPPPPAEEQEVPTEAQERATEEQPAKAEDPASDMLKTQVGNLLIKHGLTMDLGDLRAAEARLILSKRSKAEVEKVVESIGKARTGMF